MKIGIVGGGIYGCHIAATLKSLGVEVELFEARVYELQVCQLKLLGSYLHGQFRE